MKTKQNESVIHNAKVFLRIPMKTEMFYAFSNVNSFCYYFWKDDGTFVYRFVRITWDLINCYLFRTQRTETIKIFSKELTW